MDQISCPYSWWFGEAGCDMDHVAVKEDERGRAGWVRCPAEMRGAHGRAEVPLGDPCLTSTARLKLYKLNWRKWAQFLVEGWDWRGGSHLRAFISQTS